MVNLNITFLDIDLEAGDLNDRQMHNEAYYSYQIHGSVVLPGDSVPTKFSFEVYKTNSRAPFELANDVIVSDYLLDRGTIQNESNRFAYRCITGFLVGTGNKITQCKWAPTPHSFVCYATK